MALARTDVRYARLACVAAENLGGYIPRLPSEPGALSGYTPTAKDLDMAREILVNNAYETDEAGVVGEINFVRDLVKV